MLLEIACFTLEDALLAQLHGADRIELCKDYGAGGITPPESDIRIARQKLKIPLFVMIRPRAGNFVYTDEEFAAMKKQILFCRELKCDGVVFGVLNADNRVDKTRCAELMQLGGPMQCTFHRAFDKSGNLSGSLEELVDCGFSRVLTSGGAGSAMENLETLFLLRGQASGRIVIMPGGGVRSKNVGEIVRSAHCEEIHSAALDPKTGRLDTTELRQLNKLLSTGSGL